MISDDLIKKVTGQYDVEVIQRLNLDNFDLKQIGNLSRLTNLKDVSLARNDIADLSPLEPLSELRRLILRENMIRNLQPLVGLENLETLDVSGNDRLESLDAVMSVLKQMKSLRNLTLRSGPDSDATPITQWQKDMQVSGKYPHVVLEALPQLQILDGSHVEVIKAAIAKNEEVVEEEKSAEEEKPAGSWIAAKLSGGDDMDCIVSPRSNALLGLGDDKKRDAQELLRRADKALV